ncbi:ATP-dependent DNA ligase [Sphingomonas desiccabilis]|uniref:DNA ligase (ATP) n=1 Tax=Sphingomonas desiccabilis TaxID=429134 RepID=A0A4Q2IQD8_9SPHN|nr:ATP-dependent DNA ligase [Sphingomonas desiccabilis]MBB3912110.1 ATP-dependent DNA ligase [Sphingomonas desiccabilis]RXZ30275.1 ATP-dependent DNA ligase [Sphingomonas desiccabilis]
MADPAPLEPMEAKLAAELPEGPGWQFEPKWDGFRCLAVKQGDAVLLWSKSGKPLARYFPEVAAALAGLPGDFVLDGELLIPVGPTLSFGALQLRLHPAESRIRRLSAETPARLMLFDCLAAEGETLADRPLSGRRAALERFHARHRSPTLRLSPVTDDPAVARRWLGGTGSALDGVVAKPLAEPYRPGERAMVKVKRLRTADCVVGGFRYASAAQEVGSLLLGLYDDAGLLHHVGFTSGIPAAERPELTARLEALVEAPGFTGDAPGGPSRWSTERSAQWQPLRPQLVVEVRYDQITDRRFRHGTALLRWRPDKAPRQCGFDQLEEEARPAVVEAAIGGA